MTPDDARTVGRPRPGASAPWRRALLREHPEQQVGGVARIIVGTSAGNYKARGALAKAGYLLSADPEAVLRAYYAIPENRLASSVTYEKQL